MKFLERDELGHYHTQTEFLKPFEVIMKHSKSVAIREFALKSLEQMIRARAKNIKSGWKSIFLIYSRYGPCRTGRLQGTVDDAAGLTCRRPDADTPSWPSPALRESPARRWWPWPSA